MTEAKENSTGVETNETPEIPFIKIRLGRILHIEFNKRIERMELELISVDDNSRIIKIPSLSKSISIEEITLSKETKEIFQIRKFKALVAKTLFTVRIIGTETERLNFRKFSHKYLLQGSVTDADGQVLNLKIYFKLFSNYSGNHIRRLFIKL